MLRVLQEWFFEGVAFVRDIVHFIVQSIYSGRIVWLLVVGVAVLIFLRFFRKGS